MKIVEINELLYYNFCTRGWASHGWGTIFKQLRCRKRGVNNMDTAFNLQNKFCWSHFQSAAGFFYYLPPEVCGGSLLLTTAGSLKDRRTDALIQLKWLTRVILLFKRITWKFHIKDCCWTKNLLLFPFLTPAEVYKHVKNYEMKWKRKKFLLSLTIQKLREKIDKLPKIWGKGLSYIFLV